MRTVPCAAPPSRNLYAVYGGVKTHWPPPLNAQVKQLQFFSSARRYPSALAASLDSTHVPVEVYHNLISTVRANLDKMHRYVRLRKKLLGLEELHFYDVYAPWFPGWTPGSPMPTPGRRSIRPWLPWGATIRPSSGRGWTAAGLTSMRTWESGPAAIWPARWSTPYILLNYQDDLDSMFTLAHELGHAVHSLSVQQDAAHGVPGLCDFCG